MFKTLETIEGRSGPDDSLADQIARNRAPHLLIAAGEVEKSWGELYDRAGGERSELWYLPKATHTAALRQYPPEYERRVVGFLDTHLRPAGHRQEESMSSEPIRTLGSRPNV
jgi:hypothetical protein